MKTGQEECCPPDWRVKIRLMIAKLYAEDIIAPAYVPHPAGQAVLTSEPGRDADLYIDYRWTDKAMYRPSVGDDYRGINLLKTAQQWSQKHENTTFTLLKIWTHSHFYPLTLSVAERESMSFADTLGRAWHFRFIPKDSWWSEWSMHGTVEKRLERWRRTLGSRYEVRRDTVLVTGADEADLQRYATTVAFGLQTIPCRFDINLWRSFVNVNLAFLEGLDSAW